MDNDNGKPNHQNQEISEDINDILEYERRKDEPSITYNDMIKRLKAAGFLK